MERGTTRVFACAVDWRDAERGYRSGLGWPFKPDAKATRGALLAATRRAVLEGMTASAQGKIAAKGPRGGVRWKPRFFAKRLGWHTIDHAWEIEDRAGTARASASQDRTEV